MRTRSKGAVIALASTTSLLAVIVALGARPVVVRGQTAGYRAARLAGTQNPDLNGVWQALTTANWNILDHPSEAGPLSQSLGAYSLQPGGAGIVEGNQIPYKAEALAKKRANLEGRLKIDPQNMHEFGDPEAKCFMPGVPRAMYMPYPFQIIQTGNEILMTFEFASATRMIHLKNHKEAPVPAWMGWSNGRWQGDTLVVDVTAQNGSSWLDRSGNFASDTLHVVERFTPISRDHLMYEATLEDPATFTRAWKISFPLYRRIDRNIELSELKCVEFVEEFLYGTLRKKTR
jgi:hypothetical protein